MTSAKFITLLLILSTPVLHTCKPRRSDSNLASADEEKKEEVQDLAFAVAMRRKLRREPALHFADSTGSKIFEELLKNASNSANYAVRYQSASAVADIAAVAPQWTPTEKAEGQDSDYTPRVPTSEFVFRAIQSFQLKTPVSRECKESESGPARQNYNYQFQICSNYIQCAQAATLLTSFTRIYWGDDRITMELDKRNKILANDINYIECTDGKMHKAILQHKHESMKIWQEFNIASGIESPTALGTLPRMDPAVLQGLKSKLDGLINNIETKFLHNEIANAVPSKIMKDFILDEILSKEIKPPTSTEQAPAGEGVTVSDFEAHWAQLDQQQQDTVLNYFDLTFGSTMQTHDANLRLRLYLDRFNQKTVRPWIDCIGKRVHSYLDQYDYTKPRKIIRTVLATDDPGDRSCINRAIEPSVAFRTLTMFMRQEMLLPERRYFFTNGIEYIGKMLVGNTKGMWKPSSEEEGFFPVAEATSIAADYMHSTDAMNADFYRVLHANNPDFFPPNDKSLEPQGDPTSFDAMADQRRNYNPAKSRHPVLGSDPQEVTYEQKMAANLGGYNSLFYQLYQFKDKYENLQRATTIQRCILGDSGIEPDQKTLCNEAGRYNVEADKPQKKENGEWRDYTNEEKKEAFQKMNNLSQEIQTQTAAQACALKQFASPASFPDKIKLTSREKQLHDKLADYIGFNPYGCWGPVVYNLNSRQMVHALFMPSTMLMAPTRSLTEFGKVPSPSEMKLPVDYAADGVESVFKKLGLEELTRSTNTDSFFKEIPFKPALDGNFDMNQICLAKGLKGQSDPSIFNYYNSVNRWLTAQNQWDKCHELTLELVNLVLSAVTMPAIGKLTHVIIGRLLFNSPGVIATVSKTYPALSQAAGSGRLALTKFLALNPAVLRAATWQIMKNLPYATSNLALNVSVFTLLNKLLYRALFLQKLYDPKLGVWENVGHEIWMGVWFMGGMPALHKFSNVLFPGPVSKFLGTGPAAAMTNFTLSVGLEATFFRYVGPVAEWATHSVSKRYHYLVHGEYPPEEPDYSWQQDKGELYEWGHALMMTLVFRVGRDNMMQNHQELYAAQMSRMKMRYYRSRQALGLKTYDPYTKDTALAQNPYSDLFIDLSKVNYKNHAEILRLAEAQYDKIVKNEIKDPHGRGYGEMAKNNDPIAKQVITSASHALETLRQPVVKERVDRMLERSLKGSDMSFQDLSNGTGSLSTTPLEHYRLLGLEYKPGPISQGLLNGKYQQKLREINEQIKKEESNMTRNKPQNDPRRIPYQERIADLKDLRSRTDAAYKLLSDPKSKSDIDRIIADPQLQSAMQSRIEGATRDEAYLLD